MALISGTMARRTAPALLIMIVISVSLLAGFSPANPLVWQREALNEGECWRLFSAHLVHLNLRHLMMNLLGLWLAKELTCATLTTTQWLSLWMVSSLGVSLLLLLLQPQLQWYAGLSGVLHGLWSGGAAFRWIVERKNIFLLVLLALFIRLTIGGHVSDEFLVIAEAHWYGAFSGLLWFGWIAVYERRRVFD